MNELKILPKSIGVFKTIREENYLYVDKTEYLFSLVKNRGGKYFLRRPRRFGKSLTISTLEALLQANKNLFEGLWIYNKWNWEPHSVVRLDFSKVDDYTDAASLSQNLNLLIVMAGLANDVSLTSSFWNENFEILMFTLRKRGKVAVLIDEYDSPFHKVAVKNDSLQDVTRDCLGAFYKKLKANEDNYDFLFITGITKIAKTSIFSGMNTLTDISFSPEYASLCGITQDELESCFTDHIDHMAFNNNVTREELLSTLKIMYNGYRFSTDNEIRVYNPFSLNHAFDANKILKYWFESGTPTLLINLIKNNNYDLNFLENPKLSLDEMRESYDFSSLDIVNLLFQTGYLTIDQKFSKQTTHLLTMSDQTFSLRFPNHEVKSAFTNVLLKSLRGKEIANDEFNSGLMLKDAINECRWKDFADIWNQLLAHIPSHLHISKESYYHSLFILFAMMYGFDSHSERKTSVGQIDMTIELTDKIYILEFKLNKPATNALKQIHNKKYFDIYKLKNKPIFLMGISFDYNTKQIVEILIEDMQTQKIEKVLKRISKPRTKILNK